MDQVVASTPRIENLFCALELSKNTWLLGIQFPDREQPSVYPIKGGDSEGLMAKLRMASDRCAKLSGKKPTIHLCYEADTMPSGWRGSSKLMASNASSSTRRACRSIGAAVGRRPIASISANCYAHSSPGAAVSGMCGRSFAFQVSMRKIFAAHTASAAG
jgi:hypothetical protein